MPPKRQIIVDLDRLLLRIAQLAKANERRLQSAESKNLKLETWQRDEWRAGIVAYDLRTFSQRELSESEKQRWRQAIRELRSQKLIETFGRHATGVRLTAKGKRRVAELTAKKTRPAKPAKTQTVEK